MRLRLNGTRTVKARIRLLPVLDVYDDELGCDVINPCEDRERRPADAALLEAEARERLAPATA